LRCDAPARDRLPASAQCAYTSVSALVKTASKVVDAD
jgi:hypothetical protein